MKTFFRLMICAAVACVLATACNKEKKQTPEPAVSETEATPGVLDEADLKIIAKALDAPENLDYRPNCFSHFNFEGVGAGDELTVRAYPKDDGSWRVVKYESGNANVEMFDYKDGQLTAVEKDPIYQLLDDLMVANDGAYIDLVDDAVSVNMVNQIGNEENLAYYRWNGKTFGDAE